MRTFLILTSTIILAACEQPKSYPQAEREIDKKVTTEGENVTNVLGTHYVSRQVGFSGLEDIRHPCLLYSTEQTKPIGQKHSWNVVYSSIVTTQGNIVGEIKIDDLALSTNVVSTQKTETGYIKTLSVFGRPQLTLELILNIDKTAISESGAPIYDGSLQKIMPERGPVLTLRGECLSPDSALETVYVPPSSYTPTPPGGKVIRYTNGIPTLDQINIDWLNNTNGEGSATSASAMSRVLSQFRASMLRKEALILSYGQTHQTLTSVESFDNWVSENYDLAVLAGYPMSDP